MALGGHKHLVHNTQPLFLEFSVLDILQKLPEVVIYIEPEFLILRLVQQPRLPLPWVINISTLDMHLCSEPKYSPIYDS